MRSIATMETCDIVFAVTCIVLVLVAAAVVSIRERRRRRRRSQISTVAHLLRGPYRASDARMFLTVDGKTTELKRVRGLAVDASRRIERVVRGVNGARRAARSLRSSDVDGVRW